MDSYVERSLSWGFEAAFRRIDAYQRDGYCTHEDVLNKLCRTDLVQAYKDWLQEQSESYWYEPE